MIPEDKTTPPPWFRLTLMNVVALIIMAVTVGSTFSYIRGQVVLLSDELKFIKQDTVKVEIYNADKFLVQYKLDEINRRLAQIEEKLDRNNKRGY